MDEFSGCGESDQAPVIGIDIGGTWMRAAIVRCGGGIGEIFRIPTAREREPEEIMRDILWLISRVSEATGDQIAAVGMGIPTTIDAQGRLDPCPNLPTMTAYPLGEALNQKLGCPVFIENDAACFTLGEWHFGVGRGAQLLVGVTLGTGIGLGIVVAGQLLRGAYGQAGEIWRSPANLARPVDPSSNVEAYVSGSALEKRYATLAGTLLSGERIAELAGRGDSLALRAFEELGVALGNTLLWISDLLDPDVIVLGGSVVASFHYYGHVVSRMLGDRPVRVVTSSLGDSAALSGAALVALSRLQGRIHV